MGKDLLSISDLNSEEIHSLILDAIEMKAKARFRIRGEGVNRSVALNTELKKGINFIKTKLILDH